MPVIAPSFTPGSGWYQPGQAAPESPQDRAGMHEAALLTTVVVLYRRGMRIPAAELLDAPHFTGLLVCLDRYTAPLWHARLYRSDKMDSEFLPRLMLVQLERENGGVRLYGGIEVERHLQLRQAWLAAPSPRRAKEILLEMEEREKGSVTRAGNQS